MRWAFRVLGVVRRRLPRSALNSIHRRPHIAVLGRGLIEAVAIGSGVVDVQAAREGLALGGPGHVVAMP